MANVPEREEVEPQVSQQNVNTNDGTKTAAPAMKDPMEMMAAFMQNMELAREERRRQEAKERAEAEEAREKRFQELMMAMLTSQQQEREEARKAEAERRRAEEQKQLEWREQQRLDRDEHWKREAALRAEDQERERRREERQKQLEEQQRIQRELEQKRRHTPKMTRMSEEVDVAEYIYDFEAQMRDLEIPEDTWLTHLRPLLSERCGRAARALQHEERQVYQHVKKQILDTCGLQRNRLGDAWWHHKRRKGETFVESVARAERMLDRYVGEEATGKEIKEAVCREQLLQELPYSAAVHLREKDTKSIRELATMADLFFADRRSSPDDPKWKRRPGVPTQETPWKIQQDGKDGTANLAAEKEECVTSAGKPDKPKGIKCYNCQERGHIAARCPSKVLRASQQQIKKDLPTYHVTATILGLDVPGAVVDSGADMTVVQKMLVPPRCYTGKTQTIEGATGELKIYPTAEIYVEVGEYKAWVEAVVGADSSPVLIGKNCPFFNNLMLQIAEKEATKEGPQVLVVTRAQAAKEQRQNLEDDRLSADSGATPINIELDEEGDSDRTGLEQLDDSLFATPRTREKTGPSQAEMKEKAWRTRMAERPNADPLENLTPDQLMKAQLADQTLTGAWEQAKENPDSEFLIDNDILFHHSQDTQGESLLQVVVPKEHRQWLLKTAHQAPMAAHLGRQKTELKLRQHFFWPGMTTDVREMCHTCPECQRGAKQNRKKAPLQPLPVINEPFRRVAIDIVGPLNRTKKGNKFILTLMDFATRYPEAVPLKRIDARTVAEALCEIFSRLGIPEEILSDQGSNFTSKLMQEIFNLLNIKHIRTSPYHPQTDGMLERFHGTLKSMMRKSCPNQKQWDEWLPYTLFAYRDATHAATGFSPFELLFGRQARGPLTLVKEQWTGRSNLSQSVVEYVLDLQEKMAQSAELARETEKQAKQSSKTWYDRRASSRSFKAGAQVLALLPDERHKFQPQWNGPYTVLEKLSDVTYRVETPERKKKWRLFHINMLRPWFTPAQVLTVVCAKEEAEGSEGEPELYTLDGDLPQQQKAELSEHQLLPQQQEELKALLEEVGSTLSDQPGQTELLTHSIRTDGARPIHQHPYRIPAAWQKEVREEIQNMLDLGVIEPSDSPWASPIVTVRKKDGTLRLCIDYRKLNAVTLNDTYQMPRVEEIIENLGDAHYISTLDLTKGYYQVSVEEQDRDKTAFTTPFGKFRFRRMPFGLKGAPTTFQRLMDRVLHGYHSFATAYLDDVVIFSSTWESHLKHLKQVFKRLKDAGLTAKRRKCQFGTTSCSYLGHVVGKGEIRPEQCKIQAVQDFNIPKTKKDVRAFLGMVGYYRRFIGEFARKSACLSDLTKKDAPNKVLWTMEHQKAFQDLKSSLLEEPVLKCPNYEEMFMLQTDASERGIGGVLSQKDSNGDDHPIAFFSRKLLPREVRYSTTEKECLAIVASLKHFEVYLLGRKFQVQTDHGALKFLHKMKNSNGRLTRWALAVQPFDFEILHRPGEKHQNADGLSRQAWEIEDMMESSNFIPKEGEGSVREDNLTAIQPSQ